MQRSPLTARTPANLSESVHRRLNMYALAAGAAGVGMLALSQPAEGKIVYTAAHRVIPPHHSYNIDLNHDKITDFTIVNHVSACTDYCFFELRQYPAGGNGGVGYDFGTGSGFLVDSALNRGARIGPRSPFKKGTGALVIARAINTGGLHSTTALGPWVNVKNRYLGLKFQINGKTHYGWARLNVTVSKTTITATLTGYAYETIPNKPIVAGNTNRSNEVSVEAPNAALAAPSPARATLGLLATGARGLSVWRRKESVSAVSEN
jgi:hypothetical protein